VPYCDYEVKEKQKSSGKEKQVMKEKVLKAVAKAAERAAEAGAQTTSFFVFYQPKTPEMLRKTDNTKKEVQ
jgi:cyclic lactone autoinducer peptide